MRDMAAEMELRDAVSDYLRLKNRVLSAL